MRAKVHWSVYLPAGLVAALWGALALWAAQAGAETILTLALLVEAGAVPVLLVMAWLRARGRVLEIGSQGLFLQTGMLRPVKLGAALSMVEAVEAHRSLLQRLLGAGTVEIRLKGGASWRLDDMADPEALVAGFKQHK
jgi:membrane protein YdbS with pleckstrin-like domain